MAATVRCRVQAACVRSENVEVLEGLIRQLFNRRNLSYIASNERTWLTVELVQSLRRKSVVYRSLSSKTTGPLPFALGYFRVNDGELEPISDAIPLDDPEAFVRLLSEFIEPGAQFRFETDGAASLWRIKGEDDVVQMNAASSASEVRGAE